MSKPEISSVPREGPPVVGWLGSAEGEPAGWLAPRGCGAEGQTGPPPGAPAATRRGGTRGGAAGRGLAGLGGGGAGGLARSRRLRSVGPDGAPAGSACRHQQGDDRECGDSCQRASHRAILPFTGPVDGVGPAPPGNGPLPIEQPAPRPRGPPPISRSADRRVTAAGLTAAGTFLAAAVLATLLPDAARRGTWLPLHLALAGGAGAALAPLMPVFP